MEELEQETSRLREQVYLSKQETQQQRDQAYRENKMKEEELEKVIDEMREL